MNVVGNSSERSGVYEVGALPSGRVGELGRSLHSTYDRDSSQYLFYLLSASIYLFSSVVVDGEQYIPGQVASIH